MSPSSLHGRPRDNTDGESATSLKQEYVPNIRQIRLNRQDWVCVLRCFLIWRKRKVNNHMLCENLRPPGTRATHERCWLEGQTGPKPWEKCKVGSLWARFGRVKTVRTSCQRIGNVMFSAEKNHVVVWSSCSCCGGWYAVCHAGLCALRQCVCISCIHKSSEPDETDVLKSVTVGNDAQRQALIPIVQQTPKLLTRTHSSPSPRRLRLERDTATNCDHLTRLATFQACVQRVQVRAASGLENDTTSACGVVQSVHFGGARVAFTVACLCVLCLDRAAPSLPRATWSGTTRALSSPCATARCP